MREPKPPANEQQRLAALARYEILDTAPELSYDEIVKLAAYVCKTPIALVSLVDEHRQWFKARVGLGATHTARAVSFCGHVVETGAPLVVEDAHADARFADNPLVAGEPRVVFYAGSPLSTDDGFTLGSLCVIDHEPRQLSADQLEMLDALSRIVIRQLDMRRAELATAEAEADAARARANAFKAQRLRQRFFEVSIDMLCIADFNGVFKELNPAWSKILGWTVHELCAKPFIEFVHPDDRERTVAETASLGEGDHMTVRFANRSQTKSGDYRWLAWTAVPDTEHAVTSRCITATRRPSETAES